MDRQYSWKKTEGIEIDLTDLLRKICMQWKRIFICALVSAVISGAYGWMEGRDGPDTALPDTAEEIILTEEEEQGVAAAVQLNKEIRRLETYLDSSVLMQIDPYHKTRTIMLYRIDNAKRQELPVITESYLNFISNGGAVRSLEASQGRWKMDKSCLAELISAYQKTYSSPYAVVADGQSDSSMKSESLFYVEVTGKNAGMAEKIALDIQSILKKHSAEVKETAGSHRLALISSMESVTADSGLQSQQNDRKAALSSNRISLKAMTDAFSREQLAVYQEAAGVEDTDEQEETGEAAFQDNSGFGIKYIFYGLAGGVFIFCCVFTCWYIFRDMVKGTEEMKELYTFPVYGGIHLKSKKNARTVSDAQKNVYEREKAQVLNRIRMACKKQGLAGICMAADFSFYEQEKECLESIARQLKEWKIDVKIMENVISDTAVWDDLTKTGHVLMICRTGTTTHRMIDDVMGFYLENDIAVTGAAVFLQIG